MSEENPTAVETLEVNELVDIICSQCGIPTFRLNMSNEEIARVCRWIGEHASGSRIIDGKMVISAEGFDTMIFVTIIEFPQFYEEHNLAMVWRN